MAQILPLDSGLGWTTTFASSGSSVNMNVHSDLRVAIYCVRCHPKQAHASYMLNGNSYCEKCFTEAKKEAMLFDRL